MIRRYCDCCGAEITDRNKVDGEHFRLKAELKKKKTGTVILRVEAITAADWTWNQGDFCKYCVIDAFIDCDDRPKEERAA